MKCVKGYDVIPMKSGAGYYMGTRTRDGMPNCRITSSYYSSPEEAERSLPFDYRYCEENNFCSNGRVCVEGL